MADTPQLEPELVRTFVAAAHSDAAQVTGLLQAHPTLVNAAWDWGGGDWETGLGAAAHMGCRDIALCLIDNGARIDIFAAAMLGYREIVEATLHAVPGARSWLGPHGISLLRHAEAGGAEAAAIVDLLRVTGAHT